MATLGNLLAQIAKLIPGSHQGTATGGGATTLIDTSMPAFIDDHWNSGTLFLTSGTVADKTAVVSDFVSTTRTVTIPTLSPLAVAAGINYILLNSNYARAEMVGAVNSALTEIGPYLQNNDTLDTSTTTAVYTLPAGVTKVKRVDIAANTTEPYEFTPSLDWREVGAYLELGTIPDTAGLTIRVWYEQPHAAVSADTDTIDTDLDTARVIWSAAYHLALRLASRPEGADDKLMDFMKMAQVQTQRFSVERPTPRMSRTPIYPRW